MNFRVLGPFEAAEDGRPAALGGPKQRAVLAILLLNRGTVLDRARLIDALWADAPPATADKTLQVYISNLRKALGDGLLVTSGRGYLLDVGGAAVDLDRFEQLVADGTRLLADGDPEGAASALRRALALWRGLALADLAGEGLLVAEAARLEEARLAANETRIEAELALGWHAALVSELAALVAEHPLRERLREQLMLALYRSGRQAEALEAYREARSVLVGELGIEPIRIETAAGKASYLAGQEGFAKRGDRLRSALIDVCDALALNAVSPPEGPIVR